MSRAAVRLVALLVAVLAPLVGVATPATAQQELPAAYAVIDLGLLDGDRMAEAAAVNADGIAAVNSTNVETYVTRAALYRGGALVALAAGADAEAGGTVMDLNDAGVAVGSATWADGNWHAARWNADGTVTDLGTLGGGLSRALGINNGGQVVGQSHVDAAVHGAGPAHPRVLPVPGAIPTTYRYGGPCAVAPALARHDRIVVGTDHHRVVDLAGAT